MSTAPPRRPRHGRGAAGRAALTLFALLVFLWGRESAAAGPGSLSIKTPEVTEKNGEWHVKVRIDLPRPPAMMHTPMRFTFSKETVDERAIMSKGAEPEHHRVVLETPAKQIVGLDVDFADASGKVFKSTYFEFDLKRSDGYFEAGEYVVGLAGTDGDVGGNQRIVLKGDNPPVYRGAMDFSDNKKATKKGVKLQAVNSGLDAGSDEVAKNEAVAAAPQTGDIAGSGAAPDMIPKTAFSKTAEEESVQDHPKGCGCVAAGLGGQSGLGSGLTAMGLGALGGVVARRRRAAARGDMLGKKKTRRAGPRPVAQAGERKRTTSRMQ